MALRNSSDFIAVYGTLSENISFEVCVTLKSSQNCAGFSSAVLLLAICRKAQLQPLFR
jgi:hypothetical protein